MLQHLSRPAPWLALLVLAACGRGDDPNTFVSRDSSGVAIRAYPAKSWDEAPAWTLSPKPLVILGGDSVDATMDLSTAIAATLFPDGRSVVSTGNPAELLLFDPSGKRTARLGAPGDGAGEFHAVSQLILIGSDTLMAFDASQGKALFFAASGMPIGERILPPVSSSVPAALRGRLADGTFLFALDMVTDPAPSGTPKAFRNRLVMLGLNPRNDHYDTLAVSRGAEVVPSTMMVGGQPTPIARPLIFGASSQTAVGGGQWYLSTADRLEVETRDQNGKLLRVVRIGLAPRPVVAADQEKYKATVREAYERNRATIPPEVYAAELKKVDETAFADHLAAVAQLMTDRDGNLWVNRGFSLLDKVRSWIVLNPQGEVVGRVDTPLGSVLAIAGDRLLIRREDPVTRKVDLEVYGLTKAASAPAKP